MNSITLLHLANLLFAGVLAGTEFAIHYGVSTSFAALEDESLLKFRKTLILRLRILVPTLFLPLVLTGIFIAILDGVSGGFLSVGFLFRCAGLASLFLWMAGRVVGTVPINKATLNWGPGTTPKDWRALIDRAERFHVVGVWATIMAFVLFLAAAALPPQVLR